MKELYSQKTNKVDRSVIAYTFLAQAKRGEGDLFSGLAPIFKPIAKIHAGNKFDVEEFSQLVNDLYGLKVHPWAVEDLIPRLENARLIHKVQITQETHEYCYSEITEEFDDVKESDVKQVIAKFVKFSKNLLKPHNKNIDDSTLEEIFLSQLVDMSFISTLLKPDKTKENLKSENTLSLRKSEEQENWENDISYRSTIEVLCASFIVDAYHNDRDLYELIMRISTGAILSEVVLNLRDPGETSNLKGLNIVLDSPFLMSALNLTSENSAKFASDICKQLQENGAILAAYKHSIDEMKDNLRAVIKHTNEGVGFGATARRLKNPTFDTYANTVLNNTETILKQENIKILTPPESETFINHFDENNQHDFERSLGFYQNTKAQERDAFSIATTMRYRRGMKSKMGEISKVKYLFITENVWVVEQAIKYLKNNYMFEDSDVPPAMSEKYIAGLLWALYGGKGQEITKSLLLANCSAALEPRSDIINQMHRLLSDIDERQTELFKTLMTNERAGQYAMQITLGESSLITKENVPEVLEQIKSSLIEEHEKQKRIEINDIQKQHEKQLNNSIKEKDKLKDELLDSNSKILETARELNTAQKRLKQIEENLEEEKKSKLEKQRIQIQICLKKAINHEKKVHLLLSIILAITIGFITWFDYLNSSELWIKVATIVFISIISIFSFWKIPDFFINKLIHKRRKLYFDSKIEEYCLQNEVIKFDINWQTGEVKLKE